MAGVDIASEYARLRADFEERGLAGRVGFGEHPALLVVDIVNGFTDARSPLAADLDSQVAATTSLLKRMRAAGLPIFFSTVAYDRELQEAGVWIRKIPSNHLLIEASEWVDVDRRLERLPGETIVVKKYASCFFGTDLAPRLIARRVDTLIVVGCTTSGCVRASVVDACSYGFRTIVVEEGVGDRAALPHIASLFDIDAKYGDVVGLDEVLAYLGAIPAD